MSLNTQRKGMNSEKPNNYSKKIKPGTALKFGKKLWAGHGGAEETQYSSFMEIGSEGVDWKNVAQDMDRRRPLVDKEWILAFH
jgi:hypothetical protein